MSNLVTPMLTSVENSPTVDFYPSSMCFSSTPCAIINKANDQFCVNETTDWDDMEHLVCRPSFTTSIPNKSLIPYNLRIFSNSHSVFNENCKIQNSMQMINDDSGAGKINNLSSNLENNRIINNLWNKSDNESISSKACVNINMGYNDGSSLESMVIHSKSKLKSDVLVSSSDAKTAVVEPVAGSSDKATSPRRFTQDNSDNKTFKNGTKSGHSRSWGSCGSTRTLNLHVDDDNTTKTKLLLELKPLQVINVTTSSTVATTSPMTTTVPHTSITTATEATLTEVRPTRSDKGNRNSQLSFEAEFDSDGRIYDQINIEFIQFDPYVMAAQITFIEFSYFRVIKSEEFLSFKWTGLSKYTHAPGIVSSTRWFNQLNFWAQRVILECGELSRRTEMLSYLIRIIKKLVDRFNNLSSAMALMSALEVECIHRLKQTWNCLQNKDRATFRRMEELFSSGNNYEKLREHINSLKLPCIPYLGLYLTDLTYINIAHSKLSEFESQTKTDQINNILRTVSEFQQSEYDIVQFPMLYRYLDSQRYIEELQKIIEENNYRCSLSLEPNMSDVPTIQDSCLPPQTSPPSYSCKHPPPVVPLQSPISPKPVLPKGCEEVSEATVDHQVSRANDEPIVVDGLIEDECGATLSPNEVVVVTGQFERFKGPGFEEESLMSSSRYSDEESVRTSLLCGSGRKSQFQKRSTSTSIRFKRDSSSSSRQQVSSKTATLSSTSHSVMSDKDLNCHHSKSLLDDSYLDSTLADPYSGPGNIETQGLAVDDGLVVSNMPRDDDVVCTPPICRCIIMKDEVQLLTKSHSDGRTNYSNLFDVARAADLASRYSGESNCSQLAESGNIELLTMDDCPADHGLMRLICQGVLSRKACLKNAKKPRFSTWARNWAVLMMTKNSAHIVFFENSHFRALERRDFKYTSCHVQDLKQVVVTRVRPILANNITEQKLPIDVENDNSGDSDRGHGTSLKKFFMLDKEYGTVYKFRDPNSRARFMVPRDRGYPEKTESEWPSLYTWYRQLKRAIRIVNHAHTDHRDLIVLTDS